jgi:ribosomal protein S18 acetylase RimI-like enzyme
MAGDRFNIGDIVYLKGSNEYHTHPMSVVSILGSLGYIQVRYCDDKHATYSINELETLQDHRKRKIGKWLMEENTK